MKLENAEVEGGWRPARAMGSQKTWTAIPTSPPARACAMVIDDQPVNVEMVASILNRLGHEVISAGDGPAALQRLAERNPDIILLDTLMPGMDGFEVCRQIQAHPEWKNIPIIFLSAADDKDLIVRALELGGVDYITKPFNSAELSQRVQNHLMLKATCDRLRQLAEDKDELIGMVAHDLKNHLGGMHISARILRDQIKSSGDRRLFELCDNICNSGDRLLAFVQDILARAAAEHSDCSQPEPVNLSEAVSEVVKEHQDAATRKNLCIRARLDQATVCTDRKALSQVFDNLLSNAVKFSPPNREISLAVRAAGKSAEFTIRDQGPGFTAKDKAEMFERYRPLSARPTGGEPSTGLGLSIVKKLVEEMKGELFCETAPGQGTAFTVRLPMTAS